MFSDWNINLAIPLEDNLKYAVSISLLADNISLNKFESKGIGESINDSSIVPPILYVILFNLIFQI